MLRVRCGITRRARREVIVVSAGANASGTAREGDVYNCAKRSGQSPAQTVPHASN
jgi:hypothetical protein